MADDPAPAERARRELDGQAPARPLDLVADGAGRGPRARGQRERGRAVDRDQAIALAQAGGARVLVGREEAEVGSGEESGVGAARVDGQAGHQAHQHREARRDDEQEAEVPARHALAPDHTRYTSAP